MPRRKLLILFAHPALEKSRVNLRLVSAVRELPDVTFNDLYQHYPREHLDTSLKVGVDALCMLGYRRHQALRAARKFRKHDEASVRELAGVWKDRKAYVVRAREIIRSVEETMRREVEEGRRHEVDAAWDATGLREEFGEKRDEG